MHDNKIIQIREQAVDLSFHSQCCLRRHVSASLYYNYILSQHAAHKNLCFDKDFSFPKSQFSNSWYCETINMSYITIFENYTIYDQADIVIDHCAESKRRQLGIFPFLECFYKTFYTA